MKPVKTIALVAHDSRKQDLAEWVRWNLKKLGRHELVSTGTTGKVVGKVFEDDDTDGAKTKPNKAIRRLRSGPLGGDLQLGAMIAEGEVDLLIFFWDPMEPQPHDVDVKALLRIAVVYNVPVACNRSTADFIISSPLIEQPYRPNGRDFSEYLERDL